MSETIKPFPVQERKARELTHARILEKLNERGAIVPEVEGDEVDSIEDIVWAMLDQNSHMCEKYQDRPAEVDHLIISALQDDGFIEFPQDVESDGDEDAA